MPPKKKKQVDDYWDNEFEKDAEILQQELETPADTVEEKGAEEDGLMGIMRKTKKKNKTTAPTPPETATVVPVEEPVEEIRIKSKKEKEKEKKERQKQQKKLQKQQEDAVDVQPITPPAESTTPSAYAAPPADDLSKKKGPAGKKKGGPPVAALREFLAAKQAADEERRRQEEEERAREEERLRRIEEEEKEREAKRLAKKEKEKAKKEQLRKEGKLLSEAERRRQKMNQVKLEQMIAQGIIPNPVADQKESDGAPKKRVVYDNRRKKKGAQENGAAAEPNQLPVEKISLDEVNGNEPKEDGKATVDNWEEVADSWEDNSEEGEEEEIQEAADECDETSESKGTEKESDEGVVADSASKYRNQKSDSSMQKVKAAEEPKGDLRSPICVILGHVDTGKTKLLDKIRQTNVQEGEAGGITQQIGATYFPTEAIQTKTEAIRSSPNYEDISEKTGFKQDFEFKVPGLLVIDTPGHESFTNLRSRGSSLCNIAILVVDIMHGLEPQTIESINLLKQRKTPFIVALNKIDRIYGWKETPNNPVLDSLGQQSNNVIKEFEQRTEQAKVAFAEQGLNAELFHKNPDVRKYVSLVPTSAITGEGIPDLLSLLVQLTQNRLTDRLMYISELEATVLEVKVVEGYGTTIDVILSNGVLREGDRIVICGLNGPITTNIRALLTPQPLRELRVKSAYVHHKEIKAAMGVKIAAPDLEKAIAGSRLLVVGPDDDEEELEEEVMGDLTDLFESVDKTGQGVCVQASTLGSLEALLSFLKDSKIPVAAINIGPIYKKDVMRASIMLEHAKEYATILAFDVKVDRDAQDMAEELGIKIFQADIIYHLFDQFTAYMKEIVEQKKKEMAPSAIWPCCLKIVPGCVFNKKDPIILGVDVVDGSVRIGTPICVPSKDCVVLGKIVGIEANHKAVEMAKKGQQVAVRIESPANEPPKMFGRHFVETDELVSKVTRQSIDVLKESFRNDVSKEEWLLIKRLKAVLNID